MRYSITPLFSDGMKYRPDHNTNNTPLSKVLVYGTIAEGDVLFTAPSDLAKPDGTIYQKAGDIWLQVGVGEWVAVRHMGKEYCKLTDNGTTIPTVPEKPKPLNVSASIGDDGFLYVSVTDPNNLPAKVAVNGVEYRPSS